MKLSHYYKEIYITQTEKLGGGHRAYCMDGWPEARGSDGDMARHVGLPSCYCCDYFMRENDGAISFLEISEMLRTKKEFKNRYPKISRTTDGDAELFQEHIVKECLLKLYGSMLVLCWFASRVPSEAERLRSQKYNFFLIVSDAHKHRDAKMLDGITKMLSGRMKGMASPKHGAPGVICEVRVVSAKKFKERLDAVPPA